MTGRRQKYSAVARRTRVFTPTLALLAVLFAIGAPTWIAAGFVAGQTLPSRATFTGQLRADQTPFAISLPAGVPIGEILVERGDSVVAGQTVATIDEQAVRDAKERLENETAALVLERRCILDPEAFDGVPISPLDALGELDQLIGIALRSCKMSEKNGSSERAELARARASVLEKRELLLRRQRELVVARGLSLASEPDSQLLSDAISLELQITETHLTENSQQMRAFELERSSESAKLARLRFLSRQISENDQLLRRFDAALQSPRLQSPTGGLVQRVRALQRGSEVPVDTDIVEVTADESRGFNVIFNAINDPLSPFEFGQAVKIKPIGGLRDMAHELEGQLSGILAGESGSAENLVTLQVTLSDQSQTLLRSDAIDMTMIGPESASIVKVSLASQPIRNATRATLNRNCSALRLEFCSERAVERSAEIGGTN